MLFSAFQIKVSISEQRVFLADAGAKHLKYRFDFHRLIILELREF